jgi:hypothetical protein
MSGFKGRRLVLQFRLSYRDLELSDTVAGAMTQSGGSWPA